MMPVSTNPARNLLEPGCTFRIQKRPAEVLEVRPEGYVVMWDEWTNPKTGEVIARTPDMLPHSRVEQENRYGTLVVVSRPNAQDFDPDEILRHFRTHTEKSRMLVRKACALAAEELMAEDRIGPNRKDFETDAELIIARARTVHARLVQELNAPKHGKGRAMYGERSVQKPFVFELTVRKDKHSAKDNHSAKGASIYNWLRALRADGENALFDAYRNCGSNSGHREELADFVADVLEGLVDMERQTLSALQDSVLAAIQHENQKRNSEGRPEASLPNRVSKAYVSRQLNRLGRKGIAIRSMGFDQAYRDMHALGVGITTLRAMERVEIDEYTIDLTLLLRLTGIFKLLWPSELKSFGLDGSAKRITISAAIDVHTRCLVALQMVPSETPDTLRQTLEMVYTDKTSISDALGCEYKWIRHGAPEEVVLDRGASYISDEAYHILASLGITNIGTPAGRPWLKPHIERVFRSMHDLFLQRFSGRNFSNVVARGENDPAGRATLTLEEFLGWLVRWTVDGYHNRRHEGLGMTPLQAWEKATAGVAVRQISNREMRLAFGTPLTRSLGRHGLTLNRINYQNDDLIELWTERGSVPMEIRYWHGDVGAIEVRADKGEWTTVTVSDEAWIGKTEVDVREWLIGRRETDPEAEEARLSVIYDIDQRSKALKAMNGLFARPRTKEGFDLTEANLAKFTDTAERRHAAGPHRDLLADEVHAEARDESAPARPAPSDTTDEDELSDEDLME